MAELKEVKEIPRYKCLYFLEVQRREENGGYIHMGYMNRLFFTEKDASLYYKKYNPHMRGINAHGTNTSDWHPQTKLRYRIHAYRYENLNIKSWDEPHDGRVWRAKPYTPLGTKSELGEPMAKGPGKPMAEFPKCPGESCWCYDCAMDTTEPDNFNEEEYDEDEHVLIALRKARKLRKEFIKT